jgi:hypothetical protein
MSYASFASPALPQVALPIHAIRRQLRLAIAITGMAVQSLLVAAVLWAVLAAPGLLSDRNSTEAGQAPHAMHKLGF